MKATTNVSTTTETTSVGRVGAEEVSGRVVREGFAAVRGVLDEETLSALEASLRAPAEGAPEARRRRGEVYAVRNLLCVSPAARELAESERVRSLVEPVLGPRAFAVRGTLFDKPPGAPWKVAWHQDLSVAVRARAEAEGFGPWSIKAGVVHVQPPASILESMLAVRLHLDDCDETNGALRVLLGSHALGRLDARAIEELRRDTAAVTCRVPRGGALLMKPLLLHSSPTPTAPRPRRVIHLEFASGPLPEGLEWAVS